MYPGETFGLRIFAYDENNHTVGIAVTITHVQVSGIVCLRVLA